MQNKTPHTRAHIRLNDQAEVIEFIGRLSEHPDTFSIENRDGSRRIDAKSVLGVMYFTFDLADEMYLINDTCDGLIPNFVDQYRVLL